VREAETQRSSACHAELQAENWMTATAVLATLMRFCHAENGRLCSSTVRPRARGLDFSGVVQTSLIAAQASRRADSIQN